MVLHEIDSISSVINGHRIIIYYIQGKLSSIHQSSFLNKVETALEMLEKKNDDLLIVRLIQESENFSAFKDLYRPNVSGAATLFVVNNDGIPILSEHVNQDEDICSVLEAISTSCKLNSIPKQNKCTNLSVTGSAQIGLVGQTGEYRSETNRPNSLDKDISSSRIRSYENLSHQEEKCDIAADSLSETVMECLASNQDQTTNTTRLQIRLPNGAREQEIFNKDAELQEIWVFIRTSFKIRDFDLKTYDHGIFTEDDYKKTLENLGLCPSGVLIVVSKNTSRVNPIGRSSVSEMIQYGFNQIIFNTSSLFRYLYGLVFLFWNSFFSSGNNGTGNDNRRAPAVTSGRPTVQNRGSKSQSSAQKTVSRKLGNIHTLRRDEDSDDENNRYNGNSTQQK